MQLSLPDSADVPEQCQTGQNMRVNPNPCVLDSAIATQTVCDGSHGTLMLIRWGCRVVR